MGTCNTGATGTSGPPTRLLLGRGRDGMCDEPSPLHCSPTNALSLQMLFLHHQQTTNELAVGSDAHLPTVLNQLPTGRSEDSRRGPSTTVTKYFKYQNLYNKLAVGLPILLSPHPHPLTTDLCWSDLRQGDQSLSFIEKQDVRTEE